ncbi:MAG: hypothetical protein ACJ72M_15990 [Propionibacteriaceae bacterium]
MSRTWSCQLGHCGGRDGTEGPSVGTIPGVRQGGARELYAVLDALNDRLWRTPRTRDALLE